MQITTPEMYVCKLETRFGGDAVRDLMTVLLQTPNRRSDGFTLEQDLELITLLTNKNNKQNIMVTGRPGEHVAKERLNILILRRVLPTLNGDVVSNISRAI